MKSVLLQATKQILGSDDLLFNIDDYLGKDCVMHCATEEEANDFLKVMHDLGRKWIYGESYLTSNYWRFYKENTCYRIDKGEYCYMGYYRSLGCRILEWSDFVYENDEELEPMSFNEICSGLGWN